MASLRVLEYFVMVRAGFSLALGLRLVTMKASPVTRIPSMSSLVVMMTCNSSAISEQVRFAFLPLMVLAVFLLSGKLVVAEIDFVQQVQPILAKHCFACHGPDEAESGLSFSTAETAFAETESGEYAIVAGNVASSHMLSRITSLDENDRMPPEGKRLTSTEVAALTQWIEEGAKWSEHWAFLPMQRRSPPQIDDPQWQQHPIDAFVYAANQRAGLLPNEAADRATLIRRATYDLTGLPPTATQVQEFVNNQDPKSYEHLLDRLLASPQYGERWARHWLDLVRYAETNSYERDGAKPNAWKYRDYVIRSLNDDKPYDQFVREQLAGDELEQVTKESLTATGYYRLGIWDDEPADPLLARYDALDDIIMTTGQAMLGLTLNCARCHDHKIDPIPQTDYYGMLAFFEDVTPYAKRGDQSIFSQIDVSSERLKQQYAENDARRRELEERIREIEQTGIAKMSAPDQRATEGPRRDRKRILDEKLKGHLTAPQWSDYQSLQGELAKNKSQLKELPPRESVLGLAGYRSTTEPTRLLQRGNPHSPGDEVVPQFPALYGESPPDVPAQPDKNKPAGRRKLLADWMTNSKNRLTARVMANRVWQFHFGRGIVRSSNNFGQLGTPPTHPKLLDFLAYRLIDGNWKLKEFHKWIMSSRTYQMSSAVNPRALQMDPENNAFWRFDPRRLSAEEVRDSVLSANGALNKKSYGPSIYPTLSAEVLAGQSRPGSGWGKTSIEEQNRRSIYIHVKRSLLTPLMTAFDFPDPDLTCEARFATLQPGQALSLLNSQFIHEQGTRLATKINADKLDDYDVIQHAIRRVLSRSATDEEIKDGTQLLTRLQQKYKLPRSRAVALYCVSVMNWNEFLFID